MAEECTHNCGSCSQNCDHRIEKAKLNDMSKVKKIIGVISGKGGVGKSLVSSLIASKLQKEGYRVGLLDADITGPSIPKSFGIKEKAVGEDGVIYPAISKTGIQIMSANMLLENDDDPIIWRGPMIGDLVKQFYTDVLWHNVDYMVVDMPPGTGDVALTTFQYLPVDGIIIVTSPQELVSTIVKKAIKMAEEMNVPILGVVENMSYVECPNCKEKIYVYGESHIKEVAKEWNLDVLGQIPLNPLVSRYVDKGEVEDLDVHYLDKAIAKIKAM